MPLPVFRNSDVLYTVIVRSPEARTQLTQWTSTSRSIQARVEENRMHIYDHNTLNLFMVTWTHGWDQLIIWDHWSRKHLY